MIQTISSKDNSKLKAVRALVRSKKERQKAGAFVVEGVRSLSALTNGTGRPEYRLQEIWVADDHSELAEKFDVPVYSIPREFMEQISDCRSSQGILGVVEYSSASQEIDSAQGNYLLLDRVMDPGNMGTLIRSAVAFGFDGVLLYGDCVDVFNPKTVRSTMGALPFCNVRIVDDGVFQTLDAMGYDLISTTMTGGENLHDMKFGSKNVLVIGNEANGIADDIQRRSTRQLSIPMSGVTESLNAGVAGSICMFAVSQCG